MTQALTDAIPADQMEPREFLIAPWGVVKGLDGVERFVNARTFATLPNFQKKSGRGEVALDFEHETVPELDENGKPIKDPERKEPIIVAGFGTVEVRDGKGIYLVMTKWTPQGAAAYKTGSYPDLSPTLLDDPETREVVGIHSVALTRAGQIEGLNAYSANMAILNKEKQNPNNMDEYKKLAAIIAAALKQANPDCTITEDSSLDEITAALATAIKPLSSDEDDKAPATTPAATPANADAAEPDKGLGLFQEKFEALREEVEALKNNADEAQKETLIETAIEAGKELPMSAAKLKKMSAADLAELLNGLRPGMVPMSATAHASAGAGRTPTADEKAMRAEWGLN